MTQPATNPYVLRLEALEALVREQAARIEALERIVAGIGAAFGIGGADAADDDELDSKFGNEPIKKDPTDRFWKGASNVGKRPSECAPEYLDALAKYKDVCAKLKEKDGTEAKKKYAAYDRADAARARGWARRLRAGWQPPAAPPPPTFGAANGAGGSAFGTSTWKPNGGSNGSRGWGASPPAPPSEPKAAEAAAEDVSFDFGANVGRAPEAPTITLEEDDDPPL